MFTDFTTSIDTTWIDYNGHMNDAAYALALSQANEAFLEHVDLSAAYRERTGRTMYTVDLHIVYLAEVHGSDSLTACIGITELAARKLRLSTELVRSDGTVAARGEVLYLHYDQTSATVVAFSIEQSAGLEHWRFAAPSGA